MHVSVIGTGYVGLVTGACLADLGNQVICYDIDTNKIKNLQLGISPIYEPGLVELIQKNKAKGEIEWSKAGNLMKNRVIIDGKNLFDPRGMEDLGFIYHSFGRGNRERSGKE